MDGSGHLCLRQYGSDGSQWRDYSFKILSLDLPTLEPTNHGAFGNAPFRRNFLLWDFRRMKLKLLLWTGVGLAVAGAAIWINQNPNAVQSFSDPDAINLVISDLGLLGPIAIIALMTFAVVFSPIPSAPIAMVSGAIFGHLVGAIYVITGAELGALIAFFIARAVGREYLEKWFGSHINSGLLGSQNALMFAVFASRLMPFVSFDLMSYAAGLSALKFWRFAISTFAGIIPASLF